MKIERLMDIVAKYSCLYAVIWFVFSEETNYSAVWFMFLVFCLITFFAHTLFKGNVILSIAFAVVEAIPVIFIKDFYLNVFIILSAAYSLVYLLIKRKDLRYGDYRENNKIIIYSLISLAFLGMISYNSFVQTSVPFICIYTVDYVMLLRLLRCKEIGKNSNKIYKNNMMFLAVVLIPPVILGLDVVRRYIVKGLYYCYMGFCNILDYIALGIAYIFFYILDAMYYIFMKVTEHFIGTADFDGKITNGKKVDQGKLKKAVFDLFYNNDKLAILLKIAFLVAIVIIVMKFYKKRKDKELSNVMDYTEEKQIINNNTSIFDKLRPKTYSERIRQYYLNFMKFSTKKGVKLRSSDTTLDINKKAKHNANLDNTLINKLRELYIKVRYSNYDASSEDAREASSYLKEIKSNK